MKNPFMSMWLSYANTYANSMRGFWMGEMQRQQTQMMNAMMNNWLEMMTGSSPTTTAAKRRKRN